MIYIPESLRRCVRQPETLGFYAMKDRDKTMLLSLYVMRAGDSRGYTKYRDIEYEDGDGYISTVSAQSMISLLKSGELVRISDDVIRRGELVG